MKWDDVKDRPRSVKGMNHIGITLWPQTTGGFGELTIEVDSKIVRSTVISNYEDVEYALVWIFKESKGFH